MVKLGPSFAFFHRMKQFDNFEISFTDTAKRLTHVAKGRFFAKLGEQTRTAAGQQPSTVTHTCVARIGS